MPRYFAPPEACRYLTDGGVPCTVKTLATYRSRGGGPLFQKAGSRVVYVDANLDRYIAEKLSPVVASTSELSVGKSRRHHPEPLPEPVEPIGEDEV